MEKNPHKFLCEEIHIFIHHIARIIVAIHPSIHASIQLLPESSSSSFVYFFFKPEDVSALFSIKFEVKGRNLFHTSGQLIVEFIRISIRLKSIHFALNRFRCREMVSDCGSFGLSSGILPSVFYVRNYHFRILQYPEEFFF